MGLVWQSSGSDSTFQCGEWEFHPPRSWGTKTSHDSQSKNPKHMTEVTNSIKDFKNGPDKRILKNKMCWLVCVVLSC